MTITCYSTYINEAGPYLLYDIFGTITRISYNQINAAQFNGKQNFLCDLAGK